MSSVQPSFKEFIFEELCKADGSLSFEIREYLADLLRFYIPSQRFYEGCNADGRRRKPSLAEIYSKIPQAAGSHERMHLLKKTGDLSLYLSGFFRPALCKGFVSQSYYEDMGEIAYGRLAAFYPSATNNIFKTLEKNFKRLSEALFLVQRNTENRRRPALRALRETASF